MMESSTEDYIVNISKSIQHSLIDRGILKKDLALALGVSTMTITRWCRGSCPIGEVERLAKFFNMPASEFIALGE